MSILVVVVVTEDVTMFIFTHFELRLFKTPN